MCDLFLFLFFVCVYIYYYNCIINWITIVLILQFIPWDCDEWPGMTLFYKNWYKNPIFFVSKDSQYFLFKINVNYIDWEQVRVILIGFYKNGDNYSCLIGMISKDSLKHIIKFLGMIKSSNQNCSLLYV